MINWLKRVYVEILLVLAGLTFSNTYINPSPALTIRSDGKGYYDYLPAVFIHHDLNFGFRSEQNTNHNVDCNGHVINKYPCGLALLWTPFFAVSHIYYKINHNHGMQGGYGKAYHFMIGLAALVYLFIGLIYLRKLLLHYTNNHSLVRLTQVFLLLGTNLYLFAFFDPSFGHVYSFCLITVFFYAWVQLSKTGKKKYVYLLAVLCALIILVRPFNALVVLFLPFFSGGINRFINDVKNMFAVQGRHFYLAVLGFLAIILIQPVIWYIQCGQFLPWTYSHETFHFAQPELVKTLFGFRKGLFIYTPLLLLSLFAFGYLFRNKKTSAFTLLAAMLVLHYFISSWQTWWYGGSFGLRPYIDFYAVFAVMGALAFTHVKLAGKGLAFCFAGFCMFLNIFQSWQYTHGIISEESMTWEGYKEVFLKTDEKYSGFLRYRNFASEMEKRNVEYTIPFVKKDTILTPGQWRSVVTETIAYKPGGLYCFVIDMQVKESINTEMYLQYEKDNSAMEYQQAKFFHLTAGETGRKHVHYYFEVPEKEFENGKFRVGFLKLDEAVQIHSAVLQELE
ncbi:MAG TPA: hypothetical protein VK177_11180 [Flavobacteriales bacterium]|nr:hypothetical protein [Flavobacteriales bacterium]